MKLVKADQEFNQTHINQRLIEADPQNSISLTQCLWKIIVVNLLLNLSAYILEKNHINKKRNGKKI